MLEESHPCSADEIFQLFGRQHFGEAHDAQDLFQGDFHAARGLDDEVGVFPAVEDVIFFVVLQEILDFHIRVANLQQVLDEADVVGHEIDRGL